MDETLRNWRENRPTRPARRNSTWPLAVWVAIVGCGITLLIFGAGCRSCVGQNYGPELFAEPAAPADEVLLFGVAGQRSEAAERGLTARGVPFRLITLGTASDPPEWIEFLGAIPATTRTVRTGFVGTATARPAQTPLPVIWKRGSDRYWTGWSAEQADAAVDFVQAEIRRAQVDDGRFASPLAAPASEAVEIVDVPEDFDGVVLILTVASLTAGHADLRIAAASRAAEALRHLAQTQVGQRVRVELIAEVAEPETYARLVALTGGADRPGIGPVSCHVLVPRRIEGMKSFLVAQVERALESHYQADIAAAGVSVIFERLHPQTFAALQQIVDDPARDARREQAPPFDFFQFAVAALGTERLGLARRLLARMGMAA